MSRKSWQQLQTQRARQAEERAALYRAERPSTEERKAKSRGLPLAPLSDDELRAFVLASWRINSRSRGLRVLPL